MRKTTKQNLILVAISLVCSFLLIDLALKLALPPSYSATEFGWSIEADHTETEAVEDTPGNIRRVTNQYFANGFKRWGAIDRARRTMWIMGDSMTHMYWVSNGEEWYAYLEEAFPDLSFFVFGANGYSSLQQYFVLDKYYDLIKPDYLLWQFCDNDYANNVHDLDRLDYPYNNHGVRPYLEDGEVVFRKPMPFEWLRNLSFFADRALLIYDESQWRSATADLESFRRERRRKRKAWSQERKEEDRTLRDRAYDVTLRIMTMVRDRAPTIPMFLTNLCGPITEKEARICSELRIECLDGLAQHAAALAAAGHDLRVVNDGHWNFAGNRVVGEWHVDYFKKKGAF